MNTKEEVFNDLIGLPEDSSFAATFFTAFPLWRTQEITITDLCRFKDQHEPKNGWDGGFKRWNLTFRRMWVIIKTFKFIQAMEIQE